MRTIKMVASSTSPTSLAKSLINNAYNRISEFCKNSLINAKLVSRNFSFNFDFRSGRRNCGKSVDKLVGIIKKAIVRDLPYLKHCIEDPIGVRAGIGMAIKFTIPMGRHKQVVRTTITNNREYTAIRRYVSNLNYLARKHKVPINLVIIRTCNPLPGERERYDALSSADKELEANFMDHELVVTLTGHLGMWVINPGPEGVSQERHGIPTEQVTALQDLPDSVFRDVEFWSFEQARDFDASSWDLIPAEIPYFTLESVFFRVPDILAVLKTLARKADYASSAYCVGSAESA